MPSVTERTTAVVAPWLHGFPPPNHFHDARTGPVQITSIRVASETKTDVVDLIDLDDLWRDVGGSD